MNDFAGMEELLNDFLQEASEMLSDVDEKLMHLEKHPDDGALFNEIFRGFHTIKGGAGFLNASELVTLCHLTESLFDKLRNHELDLTAELMDVIFAATAEVRRMFGALGQSQQPSAAPGAMIDALKAGLSGKQVTPSAAKPQVVPIPLNVESSGNETSNNVPDGVDWNSLYSALTGGADIATKAGVIRDPEKIAEAISQEEPTRAVFGRRGIDVPGTTIGRRDGDVSLKEVKEATIRVDISRLDQVLTLSGEISLTKTRLTHLRSDLLLGVNDTQTLNDLDQTVTQLDALVVNLQNAVMKTRMQPIGRLFKKYPRLARDLARTLGKEVELVLIGEETEMDKTMIEDLNDPLVHLVRNAVDHGVETRDERVACGKPEYSKLELSARQEGDHILITIADDGRGMRSDVIRNKAIEKGLITAEVANALSEEQCLELIFLPGFSTKDEVSNVSGRGVGMDVVKTNIRKLSGVVNVKSVVGKGTVVTILLPITLVILPVLILRLGEQPFAVPLSMVREILTITPEQLQQVSGRATMLVRGDVLPVLSLAQMLGWEHRIDPTVGVLIELEKNSFILSADDFVGLDDVVIKPLDTFKPKGVTGVTMSSEGDIVLILDIKSLLSDVRGQ